MLSLQRENCLKVKLADDTRFGVREYLIAQPAAIPSLKQVVKEATDFYSCYRCYRVLATFTYDLATHSTQLYSRFRASRLPPPYPRLVSLHLKPLIMAAQ